MIGERSLAARLTAYYFFASCLIFGASAAALYATLSLSLIATEERLLGQKIELVTYDDQAKTEEAVFTANKLIGQDGVKFAVSGSYSASGRAAAPIFQKAGVPFISAYGVHPDITRSGDHVFRGVHLGPPQGRAAAKFLADNLGLKRVSVVTMDNDYGQATFEGFKSAVGQFGITVLGEYTYSLKDRQFGSIVASVKRDNPDVVYVTGYFFTAAPLVTQLRSAGIQAPIVGSQAFDAQKLLEIAGPAVEGVYIVGGLNRDRDMPELEEYLVEFQKRAGYAGENVGALRDTNRWWAACKGSGRRTNRVPSRSIGPRSKWLPRWGVAMNTTRLTNGSGLRKSSRSRFARSASETRRLSNRLVLSTRQMRSPESMAVPLTSRPP